MVNPDLPMAFTEPTYVEWTRSTGKTPVEGQSNRQLARTSVLGYIN
jgi:hypothetical protein